MSEWISVNDRLPKLWQNALTYRAGYGVQYEFMKADGGWREDFSCSSPVTHWMPLPKPPKED
jgi:hypothetical protein